MTSTTSGADILVLQDSSSPSTTSDSADGVFVDSSAGPFLRPSSAYFSEPRPIILIPPPFSQLGTPKMPLHVLGVIFSFLHQSCQTTTTGLHLSLVCRRWYSAMFSQCSSVVALPYMAKRLSSRLWRCLNTYLAKQTRGQYVKQFRLVDSRYKETYFTASSDAEVMDARLILPFFRQIPFLQQLDLRGIEVQFLSTGEPFLLTLSQTLPLLEKLKLDAWVFSRGRHATLWCDLLCNFSALTCLTLGHKWKTYDVSHALEVGEKLPVLLAKLHRCRLYVPLSHSAMSIMLATSAPLLQKLALNFVLVKPSLNVPPGGNTRLPLLQTLTITNCIYISVLLQCFQTFATPTCSVVRLGSALKNSPPRMMKSLLGSIVPAELENPAEKGKKQAKPAKPAAPAGAKQAGGAGAAGSGGAAGGPGAPGAPLLTMANLAEIINPQLPPGTCAIVGIVNPAEANKKPKPKRDAEILYRPMFPYQYKLDEAHFASALQCVTDLTLTNLALDRVDEHWPLNNLTSLNLSNNLLSNLTTLFALLTQSSSLTSLNLASNSIKILNDDIGKITSLQTLLLSSNEIDKIPITAAKLIHLRTLHLDRNLLKGAPPVLPFLTKLVELKLSFNEVSVFSEKTLGKCTSLTQLDLQKANLRNLSPEITSLKSLTSLNLRANALRTVPVELSKLPLRILDLRDNNFANPLKSMVFFDYEGLNLTSYRAALVAGASSSSHSSSSSNIAPELAVPQSVVTSNVVSTSSPPATPPATLPVSDAAVAIPVAAL